jgi:hypothetical protein
MTPHATTEMNESCAGCRFMDEEATGLLFCTLPLFRSAIRDPDEPPCEGLEFEPRFPDIDEDARRAEDSPR